MKPVLACITLIVLAASALLSQSAEFEVASVKPSDPAAEGLQIDFTPGGIFTAKGVPVRILVQQAYRLRDFQILGGPGWLTTARYDIVAKASATGLSDADLQRMPDRERSRIEEQLLVKLRALLADRFQLKAHMEVRELPLYALVVAKNGLKLQVPALAALQTES